MVLAAYLRKPASPENILSQMFSLYLGKTELVLATLFAIAYSFYFLSFTSAYFFILSGVVTFLIVSYSISKMQGICGDVIGAVNEITEVSVLLLFILI
jgi:adenosylcobinamide-GDP ribazoletransferase